MGLRMMDWKEVSAVCGLVWLGMVVPGETSARPSQGFIAQNSPAPVIQDGQPLTNQPQPLPLPQPEPNLTGADQIIQQGVPNSQRQAASELIRQTQDAGLVNDDYVGSPDYFNWVDGEQLGVPTDDAIGTWGDGFYPYTMGY